MQRNILRKELAILLRAPDEERPPALRRSRQEAWLYATDLPAVCPEGSRRIILEKLSAAGWEYIVEQDWLLMKKESPEPPAGWYEGSFGPEAGCCLSLLKRHAGRTDGKPDEEQRMLIKAGEEGEKAYESACAAIHRKWAELLRTGRPLPALDPGYLQKRKD